MMKNILMLTFVLMMLGTGFAQGNGSWKFNQDKTGYSKSDPADKFTGNLAEDSKIALNSYSESLKTGTIALPGRKSPFLASLFSLILPGAGEAYSGSYWKAAAFLAIEAAAIGGTIYYNKRGDEETVKFQNYANANWSPVLYAEWLNKFATQLGTDVKGTINIDPDATKKPQDRVNFDQINAIERQLTTFSHVLPAYGDQQYYELIGKYHQFAPGWAEYKPDELDYYHNLPQQMLDYAKMHILPDDTYYKYASRTMVVVIINHVLSAVDAAWTASRYNKNLAVNMSLKQINLTGLTEVYPQVNFTYSF